MMYEVAKDHLPCKSILKEKMCQIIRKNPSQQFIILLHLIAYYAETADFLFFRVFIDNYSFSQSTGS
jgi:hypothetical protein